METTLTLLASRALRRDTVTARLMWLHGTGSRDGIVRPQVTLELRDDVNVWIGVDLFYGPPDSLFGQFSNNDRLVAGLQIGM